VCSVVDRAAHGGVGAYGEGQWSGRGLLWGLFRRNRGPVNYCARLRVVVRCCHCDRDDLPASGNCAVRLGGFARQGEGPVQRRRAFIGVALNLSELVGVRRAQRLTFGRGVGADLLDLTSQRCQRLPVSLCGPLRGRGLSQPLDPGHQATAPAFDSIGPGACDRAAGLGHS